MEAAHHRVQRHVAERVARVGEHVHHAGVGAGSEYHRAFALHVHRDVALVHDPGIGLPVAAVRGALHVARHAALENHDGTPVTQKRQSR